MSVDILPTSLPLESSNEFSKRLLPYLQSLIDPADKSQYKESLDRATVAKNGTLSKRDAWLQPSVDRFYAGITTPASASKDVPVAEASRSKQESFAPKKRILMLGSGMVAKPAVDMIANHPGVELIIGTSIKIHQNPLLLRMAG